MDLKVGKQHHTLETNQQVADRFATHPVCVQIVHHIARQVSDHCSPSLLEVRPRVGKDALHQFILKQRVEGLVGAAF